MSNLIIFSNSRVFDVCQFRYKAMWDQGTKSLDLGCFCSTAEDTENSQLTHKTKAGGRSCRVNCHFLLRFEHTFFTNWVLKPKLLHGHPKHTLQTHNVPNYCVWGITSASSEPTLLRNDLLCTKWYQWRAYHHSLNPGEIIFSVWKWKTYNHQPQK